MTETRDNGGILFRNDYKTKPAHPDYRGDITAKGEEFKVSGWIKQGKNGKFLSLALTPKDEKPAKKPASKPVEDDDDLDKEIAF